MNKYYKYKSNLLSRQETLHLFIFPSFQIRNQLRVSYFPNIFFHITFTDVHHMILSCQPSRGCLIIIMEDICSLYSHRCKNLRFSRQSEWHSASQVYEGFGHLKNHLWLWWKLQLQQMLPLHQVLSQTSWCKLEPGSGSCQDACEMWMLCLERILTAADWLYFWASLA